MKLVKYSAIMAFALLMATSCGDNDSVTPNEIINSDPGKEDVVTPTNNSGDGSGAISPNAQSPKDIQNKMSGVAKELMNQISASDFQYFADLTHHIDKNIVNNRRFDNDPVEKFFENLCKKTLISGPTITGQFYSEYYSWVEYTSNYEDLYILSNLKAKFIEDVNGWRKEAANNLQFVIYDHTSNQVVLTLTPSGATKKVHLMNDKDRDYYYDYYNDFSKDYIDNHYIIVEVPENLLLTLTVAGKERVRMTINTKLGALQEDKFYANLSNLSFSTKVIVDNYTLAAENVKYTPNSNAQLSFNIAKKGIVLVDASIVVSDWRTSISGDIADKDTWDDIDDASLTGGKGKLRINILNKLQCNAVVSNAGAIKDNIKLANKNDKDLSAVKKAMQNINKEAQAGLYFNTADKQANILLDVVDKKLTSYQWDYDFNYIPTTETYYQLRPVICFKDGSQYSLLEESDFFNDTVFKDIINLFEKKVDEFEDLID